MKICLGSIDWLQQDLRIFHFLFHQFFYEQGTLYYSWYLQIELDASPAGPHDYWDIHGSSCRIREDRSVQILVCIFLRRRSYERYCETSYICSVNRQRSIKWTYSYTNWWHCMYINKSLVVRNGGMVSRYEYITFKALKVVLAERFHCVSY